MSHPPIKSGTRVKATVRRSGKGDYTAEAIAHLEHRLALGIDCPEPRCRAPKGAWCPMPGTSWNLSGRRIDVEHGYDRRGNEVKAC